MNWIKWGAVALVFLAALYGLDRLFLWMENRGWMYYRRKKASPGTAANAMLELQKMIEPQKKHVLQAKQEEREEENGGEEPEEPGPSAGAEEDSRG